MPRWGEIDDEDDDGDDLDEEPVDEEDDLTVACGRCGAAIFEDSERCAACGQYLSKEDAPPAPKPWWLIVGVVGGLYAAYRWLFRG